MGLGERVIDKNGERGTVRFEGTLADTNGEWLGVEWDDAARGKHDGSRNGTQYFSCQHPTAGSFVRPAAVTGGRSVVEVLRHRHLEVDDKVEATTLESGLVVSALGQEAGRSKAEDLRGVQCAYLHGTEVSHCGDTAELKALCPDNIKFLDLSQTLLTEWTEVAAIAKCLPSLRKLELSDNQLAFPAEPQSVAASLSGVKTLQYNRTNAKWEQICMLSGMMPNLEELHVCQNNLTQLRPEEASSVESVVEGFPNLRLLNLEINKIEDWMEVMRLRHLPKLERLILNDNQLASIHSVGSAGGDPSKDFTCLQYLSINENRLLNSSWGSVDNLASYSRLKDLRIRDNPCMEGEAVENSRMLVIARLPQLEVLHSSVIFEKERQHAEQYYVKRYFSEFERQGGRLEEPQSVGQTFYMHHRRYFQLLQKHGEPPRAMRTKGNLLSLHIAFPDDTSKKPKTVNVPDSVPLATLKGMIRRLYRIGPGDPMRLTYIVKQGDAERHLDEDKRPLSYFALEAGNCILVR